MKKILPIIILFIILVSTASSKQSNLQPKIASKLLRFHVVANSDSNSDQSIKHKVKDNILEYLSPLLENSTSLEETINIINDNIPKIENIALDTLKQNNYYCSVSIKLQERFFPVKQYGDLTLPAGNYNALCIDIGDATGKNWWCVMYTKLCFIDCTHSVIPNESKSELNSILTDEEYNLIFPNSNKHQHNKINLKFKFLELFH